MAVYDSMEAAVAAYRRPASKRAEVERAVLAKEMREMTLVHHVCVCCLPGQAAAARTLGAAAALASQPPAACAPARGHLPACAPAWLSGVLIPAAWHGQASIFLNQTKIARLDRRGNIFQF